jgi:hypothetical protein
MLPDDLLIPCDIERASLKQDRLGGTRAESWDVLPGLAQVPMALQSLSPAEIERWAARGVTVSHKSYTEVPLAGRVMLGDRVKDVRYLPVRYYIVSWCEDLAGAGQMWGVFLNYTGN